MTLNIGVLMRSVAWQQSTWRGEDRDRECVCMPVFESLSFDGINWVKPDSLANEPETGKTNRTPE